MSKRNTGKKETMYLIICITITVVIIVPYLLWSGKKAQKEDEVIEFTGTATMGTVIDRGASRSPGIGESYGIHFDFIHNGKRIVVFNSFYNNRWYYTNAIVGMKYTVKYLPESPQKARIYITQPIPSEYSNIEKERERILETYQKDSGRTIPKNARPLDEIEYLLPK